MNRKIHSFSRVGPIVMSLLAISLIIEGLAQFGWNHREVDEGWQAHLFQLLMVLQIPLVLIFAATANWKQRGPAMRVLGLQAAALIAALGSLYAAGF